MKSLFGALKHPTPSPEFGVQQEPDARRCVISFAFGVLVGLFLYIVLPAGGVRYLEVLRSYWVLNWSHAREASGIQTILNACELPFTVFSSGESALVQSAISGAMGMALSSAISYAGGAPMSAALSTVSHSRAPRRPRRREVLEVD